MPEIVPRRYRSTLGRLGRLTTVAEDSLTRMGHRPELDGIRALAIGAVVALHYSGEFRGLIPGGGLGVNAFFVVSGFLITRLLLEEADRDRRVDLRSFYRRRIARLAPAFALFLTVVLALQLLLDLYGDTAGVARGSITSAFYVHNWAMAAGQSDPAFGITWSLAVEEQFYLIWPAVFVAVHRRHGALGVARLSGGLAVFGAVEAAARSLVLGHSTDVLQLGTDSNGMIGLMIGCCLAAGATISPSPRQDPVLRAVFAPACGVVGAFVFVYPGSGTLMVRGGYFVFSLVIAVIVLALVRGTVRPGLLTWRAVQWVGRASYGIYLFHMPALRLGYELLPDQPEVARFVAVLLTLAASAASLRWVERPLRHRIGAGPRRDASVRPAGLRFGRASRLPA
jgi:peptidoglycan/LPS O-acetylase OafA/YrhL